jgi:very-short-patch-repair endonuclease
VPLCKGLARRDWGLWLLVQISKLSNTYKVNMVNSNNPTSQLVNYSKQNSRNMTVPECKIWFEILSSRKLGGFKFIKQKVINHFIVDFYCHELKLIIELDGNSHELHLEKDHKRDAELDLLGLKVIRILNDDVMSNIEGVRDFLLLNIAA